MRLSLIAVVLVLLAACSSTTSDAAPDPAAPEASDACSEVRAGIDAFNEGDYETTVERFRQAVPLAENQAEDDDSQEAKVLLEAVRYYAELPPDEYADAARRSTDFARYKAITLGQCVPIEQPGVEQTPDQVA